MTRSEAQDKQLALVRLFQNKKFETATVSHIWEIEELMLNAFMILIVYKGELTTPEFTLIQQMQYYHHSEDSKFYFNVPWDK